MQRTDLILRRQAIKIRSQKKKGGKSMFLAAISEQTPDWLVVVLGIGIVFAGLICIIGLCMLMNLIFDKASGKTKDKPAPAPAASAPVAPAAAPVLIPNREELIAAITAAIAEEEGADLSAIRILSFKKIS